MKSVKGTKLADALKPVFERLTRQLDGKVNMNWGSIDQFFTVKETGMVDADLTLFGKLAVAVLNQREVSFSYRKLGDKESIKCRLRPYHRVRLRVLLGICFLSELFGGASIVRI